MLITGNAYDLGQERRGWFWGHFMSPPYRSQKVEIKLSEHKKGESRPNWAKSTPVETIAVLLEGEFDQLFPGERVSLRKPGDFVYFNNVEHSFECQKDKTKMLTVRWPSHE